MARFILLDTGPLGLATNPHGTPDAQRCTFWLNSLLTGGDHVVIPEIADYELRRELLRANKQSGLKRLEALKQQVRYEPITTATLHVAAEFWARVRNQGRPT